MLNGQTSIQQREFVLLTIFEVFIENNKNINVNLGQKMHIASCMFTCVAGLCHLSYGKGDAHHRWSSEPSQLISFVMFYNQDDVRHF
jgi:hypothetical protein